MRTLTIVLHFEDEMLPEWIWEAHKHQVYTNGVLISAIAEGNQLCEDEK